MKTKAVGLVVVLRDGVWYYLTPDCVEKNGADVESRMEFVEHDFGRKSRRNRRIK